METTGDVVGDDGRVGPRTPNPVVRAVAAVLVLANVMLVLVLGALVGVPPIGVFGLVPVLVLDLVAVVAVVVLARHSGPPARDTLLPRRYPGLARVASGLVAAAAVASVAGDSAWALLAAPAGVFAVAMALFRSTALWWRWCGRAAAASVLTWPAPVLAGLYLDRDAIEGWGFGFGILVAMVLVGLSVTLAAVAAVGYAIEGARDGQ